MSFRKSKSVTINDETFDLVQLTRKEILEITALPDGESRGLQFIVMSCYRDGKQMFATMEDANAVLPNEALELLADWICEHNFLLKKVSLPEKKNENSPLPTNVDSPISTTCEQNSQISSTSTTSNITTE